MPESDGQNRTDILETGDIFFLFSPKVDEDHPAGAEDVQRFYIALRPEGEGKVRLMVAGRKHLPDADEHERVWGFVDAVAGSGKELEPDLREEFYPVRPVGEGRYVVSLKDGQMHLSYELELPEFEGEVQKAFKVEPKASFALSVKNPEKGQPKGAGLNDKQKADYPGKLQEKFRGRRFSREDIALLDYEGAEFILVGARTNPEEAYGFAIDTEKEDYDRAEIVDRLRMVKSRHPVEPLFEGHWE